MPRGISTKAYEKVCQNCGQLFQARATNVKFCSKTCAIRSWRNSHQDELNDASKQFYAANREERIAARREYYRSNKDKVLQAQKEYYEMNREKVLAQRANYYLAFREELQVKRRFYHNNRLLMKTQWKLDQHSKDILAKEMANVKDE